ncbi:hypothetical protein BH10BAC5_BH10BAC5_21960 [soil metagenome]
MKKAITFILLCTYLICIGQLAVITGFHEQIHSLISLVSSQNYSQSEQERKDCDGSCDLMKNSQQQDEKSKDQSSIKLSVYNLSAHSSVVFSFDTIINSTNYFPEIFEPEYSSNFIIESPPPRFS